MLSVNDVMLISSSILMAATLAGLEGGAVSVGQAYMAIIIGGVLLICSFLRSDLYEPPENKKCPCEVAASTKGNETKTYK